MKIHGFGIFTGETPDKRPVMYVGGSIRVPEGRKPTEADIDSLLQSAADRIDGWTPHCDTEPVPGAPAEMYGFLDEAANERVLCWRVPVCELVRQ
jgi:hypothetical protein